jgi:hypothetical protein
VEIEVVRERWSVARKFRVSIGRRERFEARHKILRWFLDSTLFDTNDRPVLKIKGRFYFVKPRYEIIPANGAPHAFEALEHPYHLTARCGAERFEVIAHKGRKVSIFEGTRQIAYFERDEVTKFNQRRYAMQADDDADAALLVAFLLAWDDYHVDEGSEAEIYTDLGFLGPEERSFDPGWRPRTLASRRT